MKPLQFTCILCALALGSTAAFAEDALTRSEKRFLKDAAEMGAAEAELGKLAAEKGSTAEIKQLGSKLMTDHQKTNAELEKIAKSKNLEVKTEPTMLQKRAINSLEKKSGAEFDKEFREQVAKDHEKAVKSYEEASKESTDPDVKAFAEKNIPTLKSHHTSATEGK